MNDNQAIKIIKEVSCREGRKPSICNDSCLHGEGECAFELAVKALEEIQKYRAIGTPGECRAAVEKQKPFKPETVGLTIGIGRCKCGAEFLDSKTNYCGNCGQKLNWNRRANDGKTD